MLKQDLKKNKSYKGFTLIELMITVAIIAILAIIAVPNYLNYLVTSKRTEAQAEMLALAQYMERQYNASFSYPAKSNIPASLLAPISIAQHYTLDVISSNDQEFGITATPTEKQNDNKCGVLTLTSHGQKQPSTAGCWK